jgi:ATP-binding cassette subfamily F protein uup
MAVLLSVQGLTKTFSQKPLFSDLVIDLREGERIGLIGPNGSGKSTLLKLLMGTESSDSGTRSLRRGVKLGYLAQDETFDPGQSIREVLSAALASEPLEEHERETQVSITLTQTGFTQTGVQAQTLSGGWRKRLALARELVRKPDFLLLDEPTNHLDLPSIVWLERLLREASFGYLVATHDRAFLRAVADEIVEINRVYPGGSFQVSGSYDEFVRRREEFLQAQARQHESVANQVRRETEWLGRKAAARTRKAASRIEDAYQRREDLAELKYRTAAAGTAGIDFVDTGRQTRKLLWTEGIAKAVNGRQLFGGIDLLLSPGSKLGLLGANGSGKSTLLRVLAGVLTPDAGAIQRAEKLKTVMFEQGRTALNPQETLRQALSPGGDIVQYRDRSLHVVSWAKQFLFRADQLDLAIGALSGGEQARVRIAQLMLQPADVLLLDEPTNDLDIPALEVLEESLADFPGAVVLVSHDRALMDRLCTEVIGLDGEGNAALFASVGQWLNAYEKMRAEKVERKSSTSPASKRLLATEKRPKKLSFSEQQEWNQMEASITAAEEGLAKCQAVVEQAATADHLVLTQACHALEEAHQKVDRLYARWHELELKKGKSPNDAI